MARPDAAAVAATSEAPLRKSRRTIMSSSRFLRSVGALIGSTIVERRRPRTGVRYPVLPETLRVPGERSETRDPKDRDLREGALGPGSPFGRPGHAGASAASKTIRYYARAGRPNHPRSRAPIRKRHSRIFSIVIRI